MIRTKWGHRARFDLITDRVMPIVTESILWYGLNSGGRIFDLPSHYQHAIAEAVTRAHPDALSRQALVYCLVSGRFRPSIHPQLAGLSPDEVYDLCERWRRAAPGRRRRDDLLEFELFTPKPMYDTIDD